MTIWVPVGVAMVPVGLPLIATPKVPDEVKKPDGYFSVIVPPIASAEPAGVSVVNENVAAAAVLPATRCAGVIVNEGLVT